MPADEHQQLAHIDPGPRQVRGSSCQPLTVVTAQLFGDDQGQDDVPQHRAARWTTTVLDGLYLHCADEDFDAQVEIRFLIESLARTFRIADTPSASA